MPRVKVQKNRKKFREVTSKSPKADPVKAMRRFMVGRTTNYGLCEFLFHLFERNETVAPNRKQTDENIQESLLSEFRHYPQFVAALKQETYTVGYYRSLYNRGLLLMLYLPKVVSWRYNELGLAVDGRSPTKLISPDEQVRLDAQYKDRWKGLAVKRGLVKP